MKIALVSEHASPLTALRTSLGTPDAGGQNVHVAELAGRLARRGHDLTVYTRRDRVSAPDRVETGQGYDVVHLPAGPPTDIPKDHLLPHVPELGARLGEAIAEDPPDLVHSHFWMSGLAALQATRFTGVPVVHTFHALGSVKRRQQGRADTSPTARIGHEQRLCREVDHVVATCTDEVGELRRLGLPSGAATVVPCGVDTVMFTPGDHPERRTHRLLVLGRLVTRKGVDTVIEALSRLVGVYGKDVELVVAGGPPRSDLGADPEGRRLQALAALLGVADRVHFVGGVPRAQVPDLIRGSDVVVSVPWYEPFGIVPLEAMACGRPVVGSAVGGMLDTIVPGITGELVPPRDPQRLAAVLDNLLADPGRREVYGRAGRMRAETEYDWSTVVARTEQVYEQVREQVSARTEEVAR